MIEGLLLVDRPVIERMRAVASANAFRHEVGGVLLGSRRGSHLHVRDLTTPQRHDQSTRARFSRAPTGHQDLAQQAWRRSGGEIGYLGEWHSHPQDRPCPSLLDRASWRATVALQCAPLVFLIAGTDGLWASVEPGGAQGWIVVEGDEDGLLYARTGRS